MIATTNHGASSIPKGRPPGAAHWWRDGLTSLPRGIRIALGTIGILFLVLGVWVRLQALYLSGQIILVIAVLVAAGYALTFLAHGALYATGIGLLLLSIPELLHYYFYADNGGYIDAISAVLCIGVGTGCLIRFAGRKKSPTTLGLTR